MLRENHPGQVAPDVHLRGRRTKKKKNERKTNSVREKTRIGSDGYTKCVILRVDSSPAAVRTAWFNSVLFTYLEAGARRRKRILSCQRFPALSEILWKYTVHISRGYTCHSQRRPSTRKHYPFQQLQLRKEAHQRTCSIFLDLQPSGSGTELVTKTVSTGDSSRMATAFELKRPCDEHT